jgi:hypothetical protein
LTEGKCLCGAVSVEAELRSGDVQACHCIQCQRWTGGGPLLVVDCTEVSFEGEDNTGLYQASEWGERGFCKTCGSTLFWRKQGEKGGELAAGLFRGQPGLSPSLSLTREIYTDRRPSWLPHELNAVQWTEAETEAHYAARDSAEET